MNKAQFGMIGLGTMGRNFLLNVAEHGFSCVGFDVDAGKRKLLDKEAKEFSVETAKNLKSFVAALERPRKIMMLVPAGKIVDAVIEELLPHLDKGDIIIDGGNSHFTDTERREKYLNEKGFDFLGVGVSGGEEGARHGASIMPGGKKSAYNKIAPILEAASAKVGGIEPCVAYMGKGSAGHFVKMVHNGIEYGLMEILAETYDFMWRILKMDYAQMSETFAKWNGAELNSFLVEITAEVLSKIDGVSGNPLVSMVLDKAEQKGTGKWTSQAALDLGVPIPTIDAAVSMRQISAQKSVRSLVAHKYGCHLPETKKFKANGGESVSSQAVSGTKAAQKRWEMETNVSEIHEGKMEQHRAEHLKKTIKGSSDEQKNRELREHFTENFDDFVNELKNALHSAFVVTYAQGMSLLQTASVERKYDLNLAEIAKIWRGGCIIRSALLEEMSRAFAEHADLPNLILDYKFAETLNKNREDWRTIVDRFTHSSVPVMCLSTSLAYFDAFRSEILPANLIQSQRDFFGAHTYQRVDQKGIFHTPDWNG